MKRIHSNTVLEGEFEDFNLFGEWRKSLGMNNDRQKDINDCESIHEDLGVTRLETRPYRRENKTIWEQ